MTGRAAAFFVHELADVKTENIGKGTTIWQFCVVLPGARIGENTNLCAGSFVEGGAVIGDRVTIKNSVQIWNGIVVGNDVFIGPNVSFTNDAFPRSKVRVDHPTTRVCDGASIGAGAVILPGVTIGAGAMIGAGSVVVKDVMAFTTVVGNPAKELPAKRGAH